MLLECQAFWKWRNMFFSAIPAPCSLGGTWLDLGWSPMSSQPSLPTSLLVFRSFLRMLDSLKFPRLVLKLLHKEAAPCLTNSFHIKGIPSSGSPPL